MHGAVHHADDLILELQVPIFPPRFIQSPQGLPKSLGHWGTAIVCLRFKHFIWIEDIIHLVESVISHDFRWHDGECEQAVNALTVEALTKSLGESLQAQEDVRWFSVTVKNLSEGCNTFASFESANVIDAEQAG